MSALGYGLGAFVDGYIRGDDYRTTKDRQKKLDKWTEEDRADRKRRADAAEARANEAHGWRRDEIRRADELRDAYADAYQEAADTYDPAPETPDQPQLGARPDPTPPTTQTLPAPANAPQTPAAPNYDRGTNAPAAPQAQPAPAAPRQPPGMPVAPVMGASPSMREGYERGPDIQSTGPSRPLEPGQMGPGQPPAADNLPSRPVAPGQPAQPGGPQAAPAAPDRDVIEVARGMLTRGGNPVAVPGALADLGVPREQIPAVIQEALRANGLPDAEIPAYLNAILSRQPQPSNAPQAASASPAAPRGDMTAPVGGRPASDALGAAPQVAQPGAVTQPQGPDAPQFATPGPLPTSRPPLTRTPQQPQPPVAGAAPSIAPEQPVGRQTIAGMPVAEIDTPPEMAAAASEVVKGTSTPAIDAAAEATASSGEVSPLGAQPGKKITKAQRTRAAESFMDHYRKVGAPKVVRALLERGEVEKAQQFMEFIEEGQTKAALDKWATAAFAASAGDFDTFAENAMAAYNDLGYFPDGMQIDEKASGFDKDKDGNITGARIVFRDSESGDTFTQTFDNPIQLVEWGITMLAPEEAFEWRMKQAEAARGALLEKAEQRKAVEQQNRDDYNQAVENVTDRLGYRQVSDEEFDAMIKKELQRIKSFSQGGLGALPQQEQQAPVLDPRY